MAKITESSDKFNIEGIHLVSEPLWRHTSLLVGGPAAFYAVPTEEADLRTLLRAATACDMKKLILGGGSNILVADEGFSGLVVDTRSFNEYRMEENLLVLGAGLDVTEAAWKSGCAGIAALDFLFGMPGTVGGALWMNARCYGSEIADVLVWVETMDDEGNINREMVRPEDWDYKKSPFQNNGATIIRAAFAIKESDPKKLKSAMLERRNDRESKGHYRSPCAGSAFKNNREFGVPSGKLIDRCGLRGHRVGGASIAPWHGNIIINDRGASARDLRNLMIDVRHQVQESTGCRMEMEILCVGDWRE